MHSRYKDCRQRGVNEMRMMRGETVRGLYISVLKRHLHMDSISSFPPIKRAESRSQYIRKYTLNNKKVTTAINSYPHI